MHSTFDHSATRRRTVTPLFLVGTLLAGGLLAGCGGGGGGDTTQLNPITKLTSAPLGTLGGANIALTVTAAGGSVTLPCGGSGAITQPLALDTIGRFDVAGTVTTVRGGVTVGTDGGGTQTVPARYTGSTDGKTLLLTITPGQLGAPASNGVYTLTYGTAMTTTIGACPG